MTAFNYSGWLDRKRTISIRVNIYGKHLYTNKLKDLNIWSFCGARFEDQLICNFPTFRGFNVHVCNFVLNLTLSIHKVLVCLTKYRWTILIIWQFAWIQFLIILQWQFWLSDNVHVYSYGLSDNMFLEFKCSISEKFSIIWQCLCSEFWILWKGH